MRNRSLSVIVALAVCAVIVGVATAFAGGLMTAANDTVIRPHNDGAISAHGHSLVAQGRQIFRFDTFGDQAFWGDTLQLHKAIAGSKLGGVGDGVSPATALAVGLKIDVKKLPPAVRKALKAGKVDLTSPKTTLLLLKLDAVVGLKGFFDRSGKLSSVGITCALCHSTVDGAFRAPGIARGNIGNRLDGWANQDLNVGAIVSLSPQLQVLADFLMTDPAHPVTVDTVKTVLAAWGPGKFDAELFLDGKGFRPDGKTAATLIPPAFGKAGVNLHTWTTWGTVTYWNAFVAVLEMHGKGRFVDERINDPVKFPVAVKNHLFDVDTKPDLVSAKLAPLHVYQLAIPAPKPPTGSFDAAAAKRGDELFNGKAGCGRCHVEGDNWTEPGWNAHRPQEIGIDSFQADRAPIPMYKTSTLGGLWTHMKRGFYHDGRFATLLDVVNHYDSFFNLGLSPQEKTDIVEYLKSLPD